MSTFDLVILIVIVVVIVASLLLFLIVPYLRSKKQSALMKEHEKNIKDLKPGDKILLMSGIFGTIKKVNKNIMELEIASNVVIECDVSSVMGKVGLKQNVSLKKFLKRKNK